MMADTPTFITLTDLNAQVKKSLKEQFADAQWIVAEISEVNINHSGHCYLELIEKNTETEQISARAKATIWSYTFRMLRPYFESVTGQPLSPGIKILVRVAVEFHEVFGFSLNIKDIEPTFTVGDLTRKRQQIILQLQEEGVFYLNKEIELPEVPQRIALISSETAAGYGDFIDQLKNNRFGYAFAIKLFQAYMQGNEAEASITNALDQIFEQADQFDAVVIIRGGGAQADLDCFNSYWLCSNIAQFPLPVLTGIGHDRDETIADLVAHTNLKTPTAVAEFLIAKLSDFDEYLNELGERAISQSQSLVEDWQKDVEMLSAKILSQVKLHMSREEQMLKSKAVLFRQAAKASILSQKQHLSHLTNRTQSKALTTVNYRRQNISMLQKNFVSSLKSHIKEETRRLNHWETANQLLDPVNVLQRGYSLTYLNGKITKSAKTINIGDQITTQWADSSATSTVNNTNTKA